MQDQPLGERVSVGRVAIRERRRESALDQIDIARIGAKRLAKIEGGRRSIAI